jgi:hypothetical protein
MGQLVGPDEEAIDPAPRECVASLVRGEREADGARDGANPVATGVGDVGGAVKASPHRKDKLAVKPSVMDGDWVFGEHCRLWCGVIRF